MEVVCTNCNTKVTTDFNLIYKYYTCFSCHSNYKFDNGVNSFFDKQSNTAFPLLIKIGAKGVFNEEEFTVVSYTIRKNKNNEIWFEYHLISPSDKRLFLIEDKGHWILEKEIDSKEITKSASLTYKGIEYRKYETGHSFDSYRCGFFNHRFESRACTYQEYINPPFCLSIEHDDKKTYYHGEHISRDRVKKIFDIDNLRTREGIGMVQPFYYNLTHVYTLFIIAILIITGLHIFFYSQSKEQLVYEENFNLNEVNNKELYTDVFQLKGPIAPLSIDIVSEVDNSWITTDFALINQETEETVYFTKDLEYYHGYSEGENWTEGSNNDEFNICGVSEGSYKIMILPNKDETDGKNSFLHLRIYWGKPDNWNLYVTIFIFFAIGALLYFIKNSFESRRWEDSYYSPYKKE